MRLISVALALLLLGAGLAGCTSPQKKSPEPTCDQVLDVPAMGDEVVYHELPHVTLFSLPGTTSTTHVNTWVLGENATLTIRISNQTAIVLDGWGQNRTGIPISYWWTTGSETRLLHEEWVDVESGVVILSQTHATKQERSQDPRPWGDFGTMGGLNWYVAGEAPLAGITVRPGGPGNGTVEFETKYAFDRWQDFAFVDWIHNPFRHELYYDVSWGWEIDQSYEQRGCIQMGAIQRAIVTEWEGRVPERFSTWHEAVLKYETDPWPALEAQRPNHAVNGTGARFPIYRPEIHRMAADPLVGDPIHSFLSATEGIFHTDFGTAFDVAMRDAQVRAWHASEPGAQLLAARHMVHEAGSDWVDRWEIFWYRGLDGFWPDSLHVVVDTKDLMGLPPEIVPDTLLYSVQRHEDHAHTPRGRVPAVDTATSLKAMADLYSNLSIPPDTLFCDLADEFCILGNREDLGWPTATNLNESSMSPVAAPEFSSFAYPRLDWMQKGLTFHARNGRIFHLDAETFNRPW
jgi:hypothetical protein